MYVCSVRQKPVAALTKKAGKLFVGSSFKKLQEIQRREKFSSSSLKTGWNSISFFFVMALCL